MLLAVLLIASVYGLGEVAFRNRRASSSRPAGAAALAIALLPVGAFVLLFSRTELIASSPTVVATAFRAILVLLAAMGIGAFSARAFVFLREGRRGLRGSNTSGSDDRR